MTEQEWVTGIDPRPMLLFLAPTASERKARLCAVACCYRDPKYLTDGNTRRLILMAEAFADGLVDATALRSLTNYTAHRTDPALEAAALPEPGNSFVRHTARAAELVSWWRADPVGDQRGTPDYYEKVAAEQAVLADLVRDSFGNPFRPVVFDPAWRTDTALSLARMMYESRNFGPMPILADAIQDAGCDSEDILNHCRDANSTHVRGCWVVDLVLGKE
jgi:hypothetical protein